MKHWLGWLCLGMFWLVWVKSVTVGSEFDFSQWAKYGKAYTKWYFGRETWFHYRIFNDVATKKAAKKARR